MQLAHRRTIEAGIDNVVIVAEDASELLGNVPATALTDARRPLQRLTTLGLAKIVCIGRPIAEIGAPLDITKRRVEDVTTSVEHFGALSLLRVEICYRRLATHAETSR